MQVLGPGTVGACIAIARDAPGHGGRGTGRTEEVIVRLRCEMDAVLLVPGLVVYVLVDFIWFYDDFQRDMTARTRGPRRGLVRIYVPVRIVFLFIWRHG